MFKVLSNVPEKTEKVIVDFPAIVLKDKVNVEF